MSSLAVVRDETLERYFKEINRYALLTRAEEEELARRYRKTGDLAAVHKLVASNLRFVVKVAHGYRGYGLRLADLVQEGNIGLVIAAKKFDPDRGYRLISYAVWWIRSYINNYVMCSWSLVKLGTTQSQRRLFFKLPLALARATPRDDASAESAKREIADRLGVEESDVVEMQVRLAAHDFSLDGHIGDDAATTHVDQLVAAAPNQEQSVGGHEEQYELRQRLTGAMDKLNRRESFIIKNRLLSEPPITLRGIGAVLSVSRERVRQIEKKALAKIRLIMEQRPVTFSPTTSREDTRDTRR